MSDDVIDRIDELAAEEKCPHCDRQWHQLPLTEQIVRMFESGHLDADYFSREDRSPVVCDGSSFIGPRRPERPVSARRDVNWSTQIGSMFVWPEIDFQPFIVQMKELSAQFGTIAYTFKTWLPGDTEPDPIACEPPPDVEIEFGPQNWIWQEPVVVHPTLATAVGTRWNHFTKQDIPTPERPGYDFSQFNDEPPAYPTPKRKKNKK